MFIFGILKTTYKTFANTVNKINLPKHIWMQIIKYPRYSRTKFISNFAG